VAGSRTRLQRQSDWSITLVSQSLCVVGKRSGVLSEAHHLKNIPIRTAGGMRAMVSRAVTTGGNAGLDKGAY